MFERYLSNQGYTGFEHELDLGTAKRPELSSPAREVLLLLAARVSA